MDGCIDGHTPPPRPFYPLHPSTRSPPTHHPLQHHGDGDGDGDGDAEYGGGDDDDGDDCEDDDDDGDESCVFAEWSDE